MLDFGWGAYHPMYDFPNIWPPTDDTAEAVARWIDSEPPNPEPQTKIDGERACRNRTRYFRLLEEVRKRGICRCKYKAEITKKSIRDSARALDAVIREDDETRIPYHGWTAEELKKSLKQRKMRLPKKDTSGALRKALKDADSSWEFRFMDLPSEIRLRCYEMILLPALERPEDRTGRKLHKMHTLLQTSSQVRKEASPIFYRTNYIQLYLPTTQDHLQVRQLPSEHPIDTGRDPRTWRLTFEPIDLKHLRLVSFNFRDRHIEMNLSSDDASQWVVCTSYSMMHTFSCPKHLTMTLGKWLNKSNSKARIDRADRAASIVKLVAVGNGIMQEFRQICHQTVYMQPTLPALQHLATKMVELFDRECVEEYFEHPSSNDGGRIGDDE